MSKEVKLKEKKIIEIDDSDYWEEENSQFLHEPQIHDEFAGTSENFSPLKELHEFIESKSNSEDNQIRLFHPVDDINL